MIHDMSISVLKQSRTQKMVREHHLLFPITGAFEENSKSGAGWFWSASHSILSFPLRSYTQFMKKNESATFDQVNFVFQGQSDKSEICVGLTSIKQPQFVQLLNTSDSRLEEAGIRQRSLLDLLNPETSQSQSSKSFGSAFRKFFPELKLKGDWQSELKERIDEVVEPLRKIKTMSDGASRAGLLNDLILKWESRPLFDKDVEYGILNLLLPDQVGWLNGKTSEWCHVEQNARSLQGYSLRLSAIALEFDESGYPKGEIFGHHLKISTFSILDRIINQASRLDSSAALSKIEFRMPFNRSSSYYEILGVKQGDEFDPTAAKERRRGLEFDRDSSRNPVRRKELDLCIAMVAKAERVLSSELEKEAYDIGLKSVNGGRILLPKNGSQPPTNIGSPKLAETFSDSQVNQIYAQLIDAAFNRETVAIANLAESFNFSTETTSGSENIRATIALRNALLRTVNKGPYLKGIFKFEPVFMIALDLGDFDASSINLLKYCLVVLGESHPVDLNDFVNFVEKKQRTIHRRLRYYAVFGKTSRMIASLVALVRYRRS